MLSTFFSHLKYWVIKWDVTRYTTDTERNVNTACDVRYDVNKQNDLKKYSAECNS